MSHVIETIITELSKKDCSDYDGSAKFAITDLGAVVMDRNGVRESSEETEVTLSATLETFRAIFEGRLHPMKAYMSGKLKLDGPMTKAMALAKVLA